MRVRTSEAAIMAQSCGMVRLTAAFVVAVTIALLVGRASGNEAAAPASDDGAGVQRAERSASRQAAEERLRARGYATDGDDDDVRAPVGYGSLFSGRSGLLGTAGL